ncbi:MAG TPA: hypothetical protein VGK06_04145 [Methanosarcina sp.]
MTNNNILSENIFIFSSRDSLLKANSILIENLQKRINVKRFRPQEGDSIKLGYIRVLIQAIQAQNSVLKDVEINELQSDVQELKEALKCR